jgi:hypothetical protein
MASGTIPQSAEGERYLRGVPHCFSAPPLGNGPINERPLNGPDNFFALQGANSRPTRSKGRALKSLLPLITHGRPFQCICELPLLFHLRPNPLDLLPQSLDLQPNSLDLQPNSLDLRPNSLDLRPNSLDLRPNSLDLRPNSLDLRPNSLDLQPNSLDLQPE